MFNQNGTNRFRTTVMAWLLVATLLLSGCRLLGEPADDDASTDAVATEAVVEVAAEPTSAPVEEPTEAPTVAAEPTATEPTATEAPTATEEPEPTEAPTVTVEPTATEAAAPTETVAPTATPLLLPTATETEPSPTTVTAAPITDVVQLEILVHSLRIRAGPSTDFEILSVGKAGELFEVTGRTESCDWMQIRFGTDQRGWVSSQFVVYPGPCAQFAVVDDTSTADLPPATETPVIEPTTPAATPAAEATATEAVDSDTTNTDVTGNAVPPTEGEDLLPTDKGCYLFQVRIDSQVDITFTSQDRDWETTFALATNEDQVHCLEPGKYTFLLVAPAPWEEYAGEIEVNAGDRYLFPIRPQ